MCLCHCIYYQILHVFCHFQCWLALKKEYYLMRLEFWFFFLDKLLHFHVRIPELLTQGILKYLKIKKSRMKKHLKDIWKNILTVKHTHEICCFCAFVCSHFALINSYLLVANLYLASLCNLECKSNFCKEVWYTKVIVKKSEISVAFLSICGTFLLK